VDLSTRSYPFQRQRPFDQPEEFTWLRRNEPVCQVTMFNGATAWLVTRLDDAKAVLADQRFSRRALREAAYADFNSDPSAVQPGDSFDFGMSIAEPPGHTRWRRMVNKAFGARHAESMRGRIVECVDEVLGDIAASGPPVDLIAAFAFRLPIRVLCELFGVPEGDRHHFLEWADAIRNVNSSLANFGAAQRLLGRYAGTLVAMKRRDPAGDILSTLMTVRDADGSALTDDELVSSVLLLVVGGYETTGVQFGNGLFTLLSHQDQLARLEREAELLPAAVEEILRHAQASTGFASAMRTTADVEVGGVAIPAGSTVFVSIDSANRDEAHFECPEAFDLTRDPASRHLAFGSGAHFCLGAQLARVQLQEGFGRLLRRFPALRLAAEPEEVAFTSNLFAHYPRELVATW
jgi:cytochrome P450